MGQLAYLLYEDQLEELAIIWDATIVLQKLSISLKLPPESFIWAMLRLIVSGVHWCTGVPHDHLSSYMHRLVQSWTRVPGIGDSCATLLVSVDTCSGQWRRSASHDTFLLGAGADTCGDPGVKRGKMSSSCE